MRVTRKHTLILLFSVFLFVSAIGAGTGQLLDVDTAFVGYNHGELCEFELDAATVGCPIGDTTDQPKSEMVFNPDTETLYVATSGNDYHHLQNWSTGGSKLGETLFDTVYFGTDHGRTLGIELTADGKIITLGFNKSSKEGVLEAYNTDLEFLWGKTFDPYGDIHGAKSDVDGGDYLATQGNFIVTEGENGDIEIYDSDGSFRETLVETADATAITAGEDKIVVATNTSIAAYDWDGNELWTNTTNYNSIYALTIDDFTRDIALGTEEGTGQVAYLNGTTGSEIWVNITAASNEPADFTITGVVVSNETVLVSASGGAGGSEDGAVISYNKTTGVRGNINDGEGRDTNTAWSITSTAYDPGVTPGVFTVNGTILDPAGNPIEGATVTTSTNEEVTTGGDGFYEFDVENGTYTVTGNADGYQENETTVTVSGSDVTHNVTLRSEVTLRLDVNPWMDHGSTQPYEVWEVFENKSDVEVTEDASVTSSNTTVVSVNDSANLLEATGNIKINDQVVITALYNNSTTSENVTVANLTVQNIDILPPWRRLAALIGDVDNVGGTQKTFLWLIIVMLASVVATHYTSAFGGLSTGVVLLTFGWVPGWVSTGVVLIGLFTGMFLAFNVAMNIDYTVMRNRP